MNDQGRHEELAAVQQRLRQLEFRCARAERRARVQGVVALAALAGGLLLSPGSRAAFADDLSDTVALLLTRVAALETKTQYVSVSAGEMFVNGTNLHVTNGLGDTQMPNGKGNLIVGYNRLRGGVNDVRTGSHCLVVGDENNYSATGGLVVGLQNTIQADYASVSGGFSNTASGLHSSVSGGESNTASAGSSAVSGGDSNWASAYGSSVSGGSDNLASGSRASVSGGATNTANNAYSSVSGGLFNVASGMRSNVCGGISNTASGDNAAVSGGGFNTAGAQDSVVSGGGNNATMGDYSSVSGGGGNKAIGTASSVSGGLNHTAPSAYNWAAGSLSALK